MCNETIPLLLLVGAPVAFLLHRFGLLQSTGVRIALAMMLLGILIARAPEAGLPTTELDRVKLILAAAATLLLWSASRELALSAYRFALLLLAIASIVVHWNFFSFHGRGAFVHDHDLAHYYLGSKYFAEIGYGDLYVAVIRADAEANGGRPSLGEARDLHVNRLVPSGELLAASDAVRGSFSDDRWRDFGRDLGVFRDRMGARFADFVKDHGYNPTPVWSLLGGGLANLVPAGHERGIVALTFLDPLLQVAAFTALGFAFGAEIALVAITYAALMFGASFDWVGGGFLRQLWFAASLTGLACLHRGAGVTAGVLFALAASLRVFPAFFAAGIAGTALLAIARRRAPSRSDVRFLSAFVLGGAALAFGTLVSHRGLADWIAFRENLEAHLSGLMSNFVGAPAWTRYVEAFLTSPDDAIGALLASGGIAVRIVDMLLLIAGVFLAIWIASRTLDPARRIAAGVWPIALGTKVSAYYSTFLVVLVPALRERRGRLAVLFAFETCLYVLALFERHFVMLCLFRSVLVLYLLVGLHFDDMRIAIAAWFGRRASVPEAEPEPTRG